MELYEDSDSSLVPETRKVTQITGFAPPSAILADVAARKEVNARRGPPKDIPPALRKEFVSGRKNAAACLHEVCQLQKWTVKYDETTPSKTFDPYGRYLFAMTAVVDGHDYQPGEAKTKKEAKTEAARNALVEILAVDDDVMKGIGPSFQRDTYGRAVPMPKSSSITSAELSREVRYQPLPSPVVPSKSNFLPAPPSADLTKSPDKLHLAPRTCDAVGAIAETKLAEMFANFPTIARLCLQDAVAFFIIKKQALPGEVVALGSGDSCYFGNDTRSDGNILLDSHAETVARRAFRRYLIQQIKLWHNGDETSRGHCILEEIPESKMLCVKTTVSIHLYLSKLPKGLARMAPVKDGAAVENPNLVALTDGGNSAEVLSDKAPFTVSPTEPMVCMSGSDKLMKWNVCGLQGSILSNFVSPVYLNSITLGSDATKVTPSNPINAAVNHRVNVAIMSELPDLYIVNNVSKIGSYTVTKSRLTRPDPFEGKYYMSANWTAGDNSIEVVDGHTGLVDRVSTTEGPYSRLSKAAFYHSCVKLAAYTEFKLGDNYLLAKQANQIYKQTKAIFVHHLKSNGLGHWVERGREVNMFNP